MATEKRLIDANALSEKIGNMKNEITHNRGGYRYCSEDEKNEWDKLDDFDSLVCDAPTIDAVEVVRCCDCASCKVTFDNVGAGHWHCKKRYGFPEVDPTDFCSYGERRTDNGV